MLEMRGNSFRFSLSRESVIFPVRIIKAYFINLADRLSRTHPATLHVGY